MGPVPAPEIQPEEFPDPVNGQLVLSQDQVARLARTMVSLINYLKVNWARCHDDKPLAPARIEIDAPYEQATGPI